MKPRLALTYREALRWPIEQAAARGLIDAIEVVPSGFLREGQASLLRRRLATLGLPYSFHFIDQSLASADLLDQPDWSRLAAFLAGFEPLCWSDHLTACRAGPLDLEVNLPLAATPEAAAVYAENIRAFRAALPTAAPFLIEQVPTHWTQAGDTLSPIALFRAVLDQSPAGALLDLHNLYCDEVNLGLDAAAALSALPPESVVELHLAGGHRLETGFWVDGHDGAVPPRVWALLELALRRFSPQLIVLEREHNFTDLSGIFADLERARDTLP